MNENRKCPECGAALPSDAGEAPCPGCLMKLGMESWTDRRRGAGQGNEPPPTTPLGERFVPPEPEELAKLFPQLEIIELLGKGGMGAVYKARQPGLDRLVAIKILPAEIGTDPAFAERFAREARALARLNHPNIVGVFDYGQTSDLYYFVMEYVDGANLRQLVREQSPEPQQALALVAQICDALQFAHDEGIVHRDIKPENILVDRRGRAKIADFGLAKLLDKAPAETALTQERQAVGTLHYMAPEQMTGSGGVDHRADLYSLGVVFYELLTGHLPLGHFPLPSKTVHVDVRLDEIVLRSLEREPERRYQRASEIKTDIQTVTDVPIKATQRPPQRPQADSEAVATRLQVPSILLLLAGILNLLPVLFALIAIPAALFGIGVPVGALGVMEILILAGALPFGVLQIVAALMLRKQQGWALGILAAVVSFLPCGLGWIISVIAGIWTLIVLNDPAVKAVFGNGESPAVRSQAMETAATPTGPPRFSRKAIIGALWAPLFLLLVAAIVPAFVLSSGRSVQSGATAPQGTPVLWLMIPGVFALVIGGSSIVGTTILGLLAIRDIRSSGGRIIGLPLALADAMLFPLLLLDAVVALAILALIRFLPITQGRLTAGIVLFLVIPVWLVINTLLIWLTWRTVRSRQDRSADQPGVPPEQRAMPKNAAEESDHRSERPRTRSAGWMVVAVLIITLLIGAALIAAKFTGLSPTAAERLMTAVRAGDMVSVEDLLASSPHLLETRDAERLTPLNMAAIRGETALVRRLLERGAEIDTVDMYGETPLIKAAGRGHTAILTALLARGAEVNHRDHDGETALMLAANRGHLSIVNLLLDGGADMDVQTNEGSTALLLAVVAGRDNVVRLLLERKAAVNTVTEVGATPLVEASAKGHLSIVKALVEHGADVNHTTTSGDTALIWAVSKGHQATAEYLLAHGADIERRDAAGRSVLHFAATDELYQKLRDAGAPVGQPELFREGFQLAMAGRHAEAAKSFEQARQIVDAAATRGLQANVNGWTYEVADSEITFSVLLAECYARSGEVEKARQTLSDGQARWTAASNVTLYQRRHSSSRHLVAEQYELNRAELDRFQQSPDQPLTLRLHRSEKTETGYSLATSSDGPHAVSGAFH